MSTSSSSQSVVAGPTRLRPSQRSHKRRAAGIPLPRPASKRNANALVLTSEPENIFAPEDDRQVHEREGSDDLDQVIMALDMKERGALGCAYYLAQEERLYCMEDVKSGGAEVIESRMSACTSYEFADTVEVKVQIEPTMLLLSPRVAENERDGNDAGSARRGSLVDNGGHNPFERCYTSDLILSDESPPLPYELNYRPAPEFGYEGAKNKLANLNLGRGGAPEVKFLIPGDATAHEDDDTREDFGFTSRQGRLLQISSWIDFDNRVSVGCAGAVITFLQRKRANEFLPGDRAANRAFPITSMEMFGLSGTM